MKSRIKKKLKAAGKAEAMEEHNKKQEPQMVDRNDHMSYQIGSVIRDKKGRLSYAKIGDNLYDLYTLETLYESGYRFYTSDDGVIKRDVLMIKKKGGRQYFATEPDTRKENNLDYLPLARLD